MRSPRRLSSPTTSERRRPRSEPSDRPVSFRGIWTRRPSARIAMATWRRLRPSNRPKAGLQRMPGRPGRFAQSTRRSVFAQPRGDGVAEHLGPMASRSSASDLGGPAASSLSQVRPGNYETVGCPTVPSPPAVGDGCRLFNAPSAAPPRERWRSLRARKAPERPGRREPSSCEPSRSIPAQAGAESEGQ